MSTSGMTDLQKFVEQEKANMDKARLEAIRAKGDIPFLPSLQPGDTPLVLLPEVPKNYRFQDKADADLRKLVVVRKPADPESMKYAWSVSANSPTYREVLDLLVKAPIQIVVTRVGKTASDTRYSIRIAQ